MLDVSADEDFPQVREAAAATRGEVCRAMRARSQIVIAGTDHYMENRQKELVAAIVPFLQRVFAGRC